MQTYAYEMSEFAGDNTLSTRVDDDFRQFVEWAAEQAGVSTCEFVRRVIHMYRLSKQGNLSCPNCREELNLSV